MSITIPAIIAEIVEALQYAPAAINAGKELVGVWQEQTGETVTQEQWDSIDPFLKSAAEYVQEDAE